MKYFIEFSTKKEAATVIGEIEASFKTEVLNVGSITTRYMVDPLERGNKFYVGIYDEPYNKYFTVAQLSNKKIQKDDGSFRKI